MEAVINRLGKHLKRNMPQDIRIATLYQRPAFNKTDLKPDYLLHSTDDWLVFPYEISGLSIEEIREHKPYLADMIQSSP